jgi:flavin reductase (DIM6/NTAB) family NADH-FMN oxidoreductase RutF
MSEQSNLRVIQPESLTDNVFKIIDKDWMLVTAGDLEDFNMMTASWGGMGILWGRPVCFVFVRPQRHTFGYMERATHFTLTFFDETYHDALNYCGTHSGRDVDKVAETGLSPVPGEAGAVYFSEGRLVVECRKLYAQDIQEANFIETSIVNQAYEARDFHRIYVGEITRMLAR